MKKRSILKKKESGVSPVIGVMLMLVVTIVIAAVVSGFAGGLTGGTNQKAPSLSMDIHVVNSGDWRGSHFSAAVTGVSEAIPTKDLKLITAWKAKNLTTLQAVSGGNTSTGGVGNVDFKPGMKVTGFTSYGTFAIAPYGFGPGVLVQGNPTCPYCPNQSGLQAFGNYSLLSGTTMYAEPAGLGSGAGVGGAGSSAGVGYGVVTPFVYTTGTSGKVSYLDTSVDPMDAVMGKGWQDLRAGDTVSLSMIHVPTGKTVFQRDVQVE